MRRDSNQQKIAIAVGIALSAGMFSIVPVAYGAPVGGTVTTGGASIAYNDAANGGKDTSITSTTMNNVIDWQDFSVAKGEKVVFDGGTTVVNENDPTQGAHNYMNIVSGANTSQIDGAIKGGNEVYIINPNGVIFGETASVDVGSLYASTRYVSSEAAVAAATAGDMTTVLADTSAGVATDVVNLGTINATNVVMEGQNVRFVNDSAKTNNGITGVTANAVVLKTDTTDGGYIHVGNADGSDNGYIGQSLITAADENIEYYKLVDSDNWSEINRVPNANYMLKEDIDASNGFTIISSTFTGKLDGNGYGVKNLTSSQGVFSHINSGEIFNFGVKNSTIYNSSDSDDVFTGAIANKAINTIFSRVYSDGTTVTGANPYNVGSLIGYADSVTIDNSYSNGDTNGGGIFAQGFGSGTITVKNSYHKGNQSELDDSLSGIFNFSYADVDISNSYTEASGFFSDANSGVTVDIKNSVAINADGESNYYNAGGISGTLAETTSYDSISVYKNTIGISNISNTGGVTINESTGAVTRPTWRIYEGQSTPVLTSQLKGITTVSYDYAHGSQSGVNYATKTDSNGNSYNVGADLTATSRVTISNSDGTTSNGVLTYNGSYMNVDEDSLSFGGNADASLVSYSESGTTGVRNAKTKALFYSAQDGYDIVGGNVTMAKRQVTVEGTDLDFSHVYDGATDVTTEFQTAFSSSSGTGTAGGILAEDVGSVGIGFSDDFSANFVNKNVGENKRINLTGSLELTGSGDIRDNYELAASSADLSTTNVTGTITQRPIYLTVTEPTDDRLNKTYNGNNAVNSSVSASDIFSIDGTIYDVGTQNPGYGKINGDTVTLATGSSTPTYVDVDTAGNVTDPNAVNAGAHKILFSGIALTGTDANNYKLQYSDTQTDVTNSQVFMDGVIRPRLLAADGFQVRIPNGETDSAGNPVYTTAAANKTYDGTSTYNVPDNAVLVANTGSTTGTTGILAADTENLWFDLSSGSRSYFKDSSGNETDMAGGTNAATQVAYAVDAVTTTGYEYLKGNYTFDETTAASNTPASWTTLNNTIPTVSGAGTISRRNITIAVSNAENINKPYDGNANVVGTGYTTMGGTYLNYASGSDKLLINDADAIANADATLVNGNINAVPDSATWNISAAYTDKNVAREADGSVADNGKTVNFVVAITGDDAVNYTLNGQNAETTSVTLTGTGKIAPVTLTPTFASISKTYNGTNRIDDSDSTATGVGTVTGLTYTDANGNTVTDNVSVTYQNGYSTANAYYVSEDYNGNAGEDLAVYYPHLTLTGTDAVNYDLASTTGEGTGTINRRTILTDGFQVLNNGTAADGSKVYDGSDIYELPDGATLLADTTANGNTGVIAQDQANLWFALDDTVDSYFTDSAGTRTPKVADAERIAYQAGAVTNAGYEYLLNNYKIGADEASAVNLTADGTYSVFGDGHIDRREITIDINNATGIDKDYNAGTDLVGAGDINIGGDYLNYASGSTANDKLLVDAGTSFTDNARWNVTAAYDNKNVVWDDDGNVVDNGKTINFKIAITSDDAANYTLNGVNAEDTAATPLILTGTGKINPKELTATFDSVTKIYNTTTRINDQDSNVTGGGTVTPITGDTVRLSYNPDEAYYDTPDAESDKTVYYPNLSLVGADSGNYVLSGTTGIGTGSITPATVTLDNFVFDFADVTRVYNGETAVSDSTQGITADQFITDSYIDLGSGRFDFRDYISNLNAGYESPNVSANTGTGNVTYSFNLNDITIPNISITGDYQNYFATEDGAITRAVGTITPKTVYARINNPVVTKTYNSDYDVQTTAPLVTYTGLVGNSTDATTAEYLDKNQGRDKLVQYNVAISDNSNYEIKYNQADLNMTSYWTAENGPVITADDIITTVVTPNNIINPKDLRITFGDVTKEYDSTTSVLPSQVTPDFDTVQGNDEINLVSYNAVYNSPNVAEANTVYYTNITISGNDDGNYNLVDSSGNAVTAASTVTGAGTITPLDLSGDLTFSLGAVTKEYNNDTDVQFTGTVGGVEYYRDNSTEAVKNYITAPTRTVNGISQQMGYELYSAQYDNDDASVGTHAATFQIGIRNTNYNMENVTINGNAADSIGTNGVYYFHLTKDNATITPRKVYVSLSENLPTITKTYDGDRTIDQNVSNMIIAREGDLLADGTSVNNEASVINAQYDTKDAGDKTVIYNVELTGAGAGYYEIHRLENLGTDDDTVYSTLEGVGTITKATLTFNPDAIDKPYDGTSGIVLDADALQLTGVTVGGVTETVTLTDGALAAITGTYGKGGSEAAFESDANVSWNGNTVADKDVQYTGLSAALDVMNSSDATNTISKNYTIADTAYFTAAQAKGKIKPIAITNAAVENWTPITREYNADTDLTTVYERGSTSGNTLGIHDILKLTLTDSSGNTVTDSSGNALTVTYTATGSYDDKIVGDNKTLNFQISSVTWQVADSAGNKNYVLDDSVLNSLQGATLTSDSNNQITARQLNGSVTNPTGNRKIYDGSRSADASNFVIDADDQAVLQKDGLLNDVVITALYDTKEASVDPDEDDTNTKDITYSLSMSTANSNYAMPADSTAQGDIERRKVYVDGTSATGINKDYDGTTALPDGIDYNSMGFALRDSDDSSKTGLVAGEEAVTLDSSNITGSYTRPNVNRAADGSVIARDITFTGFELDDSSAASDISKENYILIDANGSGIIRPLPLSVTIAEAPRKTYDGTTTIKGTAAANENLVPYGLLAGENANILINSANYNDANAGTNKGYTYNITLGNENYTLVQGTNAPDISVSGNGLKGKITANDGTIEKRIVTPTVNGMMSKVYDGTTDGTQNAVANVSLGNVINGDNVGLTAKAVYDNPNAGKSEGSAELQNHKVTYTLNLSNPNYQLADDTITGTGTISRKGLTIVATPVQINSGEAMPKFSGTVQGLVAGDTNLASGFTFGTLPTVTNMSVGSNPVYGWYRNQTAGNYGLNYTFSQDAGNETAFTVQANRVLNDNPDTKITPSSNIYNQISKDMNSGFGDKGAAAIEYKDKSGNVIARENINSGEIHGVGVEGGNDTEKINMENTTLANIGIAGGDIVNMEGADAASIANVEVEGDGSVVNLEVFSLTRDEQSGSNGAAEITSSGNGVNDGSKAVAEIELMDEIQNVDKSASAAIQIVDESGKVLKEDNEDKTEKKEKKGEIAIESSNSQVDDEIELKTEGKGVNVA